jgi:MFS transporter, BCD family, chlorophyll transporter
MKGIAVLWRALRALGKTLQLALPKLGVGWMFALLTIDFNRIAIVELGISAILITTMLGLHHFLSPFQVVLGRFGDQHPLFGYRRTPYLLLGSLLASGVFLLLPSTAQAMGAGAAPAFVAGFGLLILFGIATAMIGDAHHALIAEVTTTRERGGVIAVVWTFTIISTIASAIVMNIVRPEYSPEAMQRLYNLTPWIVLGSTLLGVLGVERRLRGAALAAATVRAAQVAPAGNPLAAALQVLQSNRQVLGFFAFIFIAIFSIFLQDSILEVFGAEVFNLSVTETTRFQPTWGGGVLLGMMLMGLLSVFRPIERKTIALVGAGGTAAGMALLATAALSQQFVLVSPALLVMGLFTGFFNVGALAMMMDMTIEGATGLYMGLWGVAQAYGTGLSSLAAGALHTGLIETGWLTPQLAYGAIFTCEAVGMVIAAAILRHLSVQQFQAQHQANLTRHDLTRTLEATVTA